jgi:glucose/arabinose dehydrogenase
LTGGQGGLVDVVVHPDFANNSLIYLSLIESDDGGATRGAVVVRGKLTLSPKPVVKELERIRTQMPKRRGRRANCLLLRVIGRNRPGAKIGFGAGKDYAYQ